MTRLRIAPRTVLAALRRGAAAAWHASGSTWSSKAASGALLLVLAGWFILLRPQSLGGPAEYVVVRGTSMQPTYGPGDLVIVHRNNVLATGDVVAYRVPAGEIGAGQVVIHRIIGGDAAGGFSTRGDANPFTDPWVPRGDDVVGTPWLVIHHGGGVLAFIRAPLTLGSAAAALAVATVILWEPRRRGSSDAGTASDADHISA